MPRYITLVNYTDKGVEEIRQSKARVEVAKVALSSMGAKLIDYYMMMGPWDLVIISEVPDDLTAARAQLLNEFKGHARTETYRLFDKDEYDEILASMPADRDRNE